MVDPDLSQFMTPPKDDVHAPDLSAFMGAPVSDADQHLAHPTVADMLRPLQKPVGGRLGAAVRGADRGIVPAGTAVAGMTTGAGIGALAPPPFDAATIPAGALIGGGLGYWAGKKAQQSVFDALPQGALQTMGQDPASVKLDRQTYPLTSTLSESIPSILTGGAGRGLLPPAVADMAMLTTPATPQAATMRDTINATRAAAQRQGIALPTTLTSPTGYRASRLLPGLGSGAIDTAEAAAPQAVGNKLQDMAATYLKPTEPGEAGSVVQDAAAKWAEKQRLTGGDLIDSAGKQAAGIPLAPTSTLDYIDTEIQRLSANPIANQSQIGMLSKLKGDLSNTDTPLDLNRLQDLRTSLYRNATPEGLSASAAAKTRGDLWTTLSDDIHGGLTSAADAGNTAAGDALTDFNSGTAVWKNRQDALKSTLGKILGGDTQQTETQIGDMTTPLFVADKSPEAAASAITKLVGSDRRGVRTLMGTLDDDAKDTVRASVIASLGKDAQGNFSAPVFLKQMNAIPDVTRDALFGAEHAAALDDLQTVVRNIGQAQGRSHSWGSLGAEMAIPAMLGFGLGGAHGAGEGVLAMAGVNSTAAYFLSRPDTLKWVSKLAAAANGGNSAPVIAKLATAARSSPALASLYDTVTQAGPALAEQPKGTKAAMETRPAFDPSKMSDEELQTASPAAPLQSDANRVAMINGMAPKEAMALTIAGEASNNPAEMAGVGHVMANRLASGKYGSTLADVLKPEEFNVWENPEALAKLKGTPKYHAALGIADQILAGKQPDVTGGAQHYYAPAALADLHKSNPEKYPNATPSFAQGDGVPLGQSVFYP